MLIATVALFAGFLSSQSPNAQAGTDVDEQSEVEVPPDSKQEFSAADAGPPLPEMVVIPAGSFQMGCVSGSEHCHSDEKPVHEVKIDSFALSKYEVTFEEYDAFTDATGRERADDEGWGRGRRPVINVSWRDAVAYTHWLSDQMGKTYRLPSEAEWEYAARAGTETVYSWGIILVTTAPIVKSAVGGIMRRQHQWARSRPIVGDFTTCTAMCGSGGEIVRMRITRGHLQMVLPGCLETAIGMCCVVVR